MDPDKLADLDVHVQCTLYLKEGTEFGEKKSYTHSLLGLDARNPVLGG